MKYEIRNTFQFHFGSFYVQQFIQLHYVHTFVIHIPLRNYDNFNWNTINRKTFIQIKQIVYFVLNGNDFGCAHI